jgi:hypothetical protein
MASGDLTTQYTSFGTLFLIFLRAALLALASELSISMPARFFVLILSRRFGSLASPTKAS